MISKTFKLDFKDSVHPANVAGNLMPHMLSDYGQVVISARYMIDMTALPVGILLEVVGWRPSDSKRLRIFETYEFTNPVSKNSWDVPHDAFQDVLTAFLIAGATITAKIVV